MVSCNTVFFNNHSRLLLTTLSESISFLTIRLLRLRLSSSFFTWSVDTADIDDASDGWHSNPSSSDGSCVPSNVIGDDDVFGNISCWVDIVCSFGSSIFVSLMLVYISFFLFLCTYLATACIFHASVVCTATLYRVVVQGLGCCSCCTVPITKPLEDSTFSVFV